MRRKGQSIGPFAPPTPSEAESDEAQPMAAARDEDTPFDSALPTTARKDAYAPDVARKWAAHGATGKGVTERRDENRAQEEPEGYSEVDERGYRRPEPDEPRH